MFELETVYVSRKPAQTISGKFEVGPTLSLFTPPCTTFTADIKGWFDMCEAAEAKHKRMMALQEQQRERAEKNAAATLKLQARAVKPGGCLYI